MPCAALAHRLQRPRRICRQSGLVAEYQQAFGGAPAEPTIQGHRLLHRSQAEDAALLGRFDDIGAHPIAVDAPDLREAGQEGLQCADPHLHSFLNHVVEPGMFQRRERVAQVWQVVLFPRHGDDFKIFRTLAA